MLKTFTFLLLAALTLPTRADGLARLQDFIQSARSGRADFTQVVTSPPKEGRTPRQKTSSGTFEFERPGRFRFVYRKPFAQTIVADGRTLWMYDAELNQVTAREQDKVLGTTPAALIAAASDLSALEKDFELANASDADGLEWVLATPKTRDGQLQSVRVGFKGGQLAALDILDSFGQRSLLTFSRFDLDPRFAPDTFRFSPPAGADVLRQ